MNFYPHHIGDFNSRTRHLTRVERSVYRDAIELQYDTELPLNNDIDKLAKRLLCVSDEEKNALKSVLDEFFKQTDSGFVNERCTREIEKYRLNTSAKARAGIASAALRKQKSTCVEQKSTGVANHEPVTKNHEPVTKDTRAIAPPDGVSPSVWVDFQKLRRQKKAPVTQTAIDGIKREADKAGVTLEAALAVCCQRGWTGFKADWMAQPVNRNDVAVVTVPSRQGVDPALAKLIADAGKAKPPSEEIRAKMAAIRG